MARISGVDLPREKRVEVGLTYIFGIGRASAIDILKKARVNPDTRVAKLTEDEVSRLREVIDSDHRVEGDLRREIVQNIKRLQDIGSYRGLRHRRKLPVRGQRTSTNARVARGSAGVKRTISVGRKAKELARRGG
jgi:small subunit ribosomal protein S13